MNMKKWYTLLGIGLLGMAFTLCSLSVSTTEKTELSKDYVITDVSCGTYLVINDNPDFSLNKVHWNDFAELSNVLYGGYRQYLNDPYLVRSQRWIRENNIRAKEFIPTAFSTSPLAISTKLSC